MSMQTKTGPDTSRYAKSKALFEIAPRYLAGGNSRLTIYHKPHPIYLREGYGCQVWDVDGNRYLDFINNYTSLIHGHAHPEVEADVSEAIHRGTAFAAATEAELELAQLLCERLPVADQFRFVNSGSEAVMTAIKAARAFTGKSAIAKFEGAYHGSYDYAEVSEASLPEDWGELDRPNSLGYVKGTPKGVLEDVVVLPFNHLPETVNLLENNKERLAAVLLDVMPLRLGIIPPDKDFLQGVQACCRKLGILLILDDVVNYRLGYNGSPGLYDLDPDLITLAKIIGGGFPAGAVGGKRSVMAVFDPTLTGKPAFPHGGTYNANPISMVAGYKTLELMTPAEYGRINHLGELARKGLTEVIQKLGVSWQVTGEGSLFELHPFTHRLRDYRSRVGNLEMFEKVGAVHRGLLDDGIFISAALIGCISTPMSEIEINELVEKVEKVLQTIEG